MKNSLLEKIKSFSIFSRLSVLSLQIFSNHIFYDHEADAFVSPYNPDYENGKSDKLIDVLFGGLIRWDSQYFLHIAEYGYTHENTLVFFPLYPMTLRVVAYILFLPLQIFINFHSCLILSAVLLNFILFVKCSIFLFELGKEVLENEVLAYKATLLFCFNPASIFFTAPYSETLYFCLFLYSVYFLQKDYTFFSSLYFFLASSVRSNGIVSVGLLIYSKLQECYKYYLKLYEANRKGNVAMAVVLILTFNHTLIPLVYSCCMVALPFALYQYWCYLEYCNVDENSSSQPGHIESFLRTNFLHSPDLGDADWCFNDIPVAYSYIQNKYWQVGYLRYYSMRQIPNFLLATPIVLMIICHASLYFIDNMQVCLRLGMIPPQCSVKSETSDSVWHRKGINSPKIFVYTIHSVALCLFCVLFINVQVTTRLICSSCPVVYWFAASLIDDSEAISESNLSKYNSKDFKSKSASSENLTNSSQEHSLKFFAKKSKSANIRSPINQKSFFSSLKKSVSLFFKKFFNYFHIEFPETLIGKVVIFYFLTYYIVGTALFANFLPWT